MLRGEGVPRLGDGVQKLRKILSQELKDNRIRIVLGEKKVRIHFVSFVRAAKELYYLTAHFGKAANSTSTLEQQTSNLGRSSVYQRGLLAFRRSTVWI